MRRVIPFLLRGTSTTSTFDNTPTNPAPLADMILCKSPQHRARRILAEQPHRGARTLAFLFEIQEDHCPALRSVIEEMGDMVVSRLGGKNTPVEERAFTAAIVALAHIRAVVFPAVAAGDPDYRNAPE